MAIEPNAWELFTYPNHLSEERFKSMQRKCVLKTTKMAMLVLIACAFTAMSTSVWAANDDRGDRDKHCSNRTLHGNYGLTIEGLLAIPGPGIQVRGVVLQGYDGDGHITQV